MHTAINRPEQETGFPFETAEETLVVDERGAVRPSEQVERKLVAMLNTATLPVSQLHQAHRLCRKQEG